MPISKKKILRGGSADPCTCLCEDFFMRKIIVAGFVVCLILHFSTYSYAAYQDREIDRILSSAESLFKAMRVKDYVRMWEFLSSRSKDEIVESTLSAVTKSGGHTFSEEQIRSDFAGGGAIAQSYWNGYLQYFDPDTVLEESRWQMGSIKENEAEILITYRKSDNPAKVRMFNENGLWKVGLIETFGTHE
jgi:hypothetical protein